MFSTKTILLIDDDRDTHTIYKRYIENAGYNFFSAFNGQQGLDRLCETDIDLILLDYMMPDINGLDVCNILSTHEKYSHLKNIPIIMLTVLSDDVVDREKLMNLGLTLFLQKPFGFKELLEVIKNVLLTNDGRMKNSILQQAQQDKAKQLAVENEKLRSQIEQAYNFDNFIGTAKSMHDIVEKIMHLSKTDACIMIFGENGTGKEFIARSIHARSSRNNGAFISLDCTALPPPIFNTELFGYEKGAFTGANHTKQGLLESAHEGTLLLKEICELTIEQQATLLQVLQERQLKRIGGTYPIDVNIRVISTTSTDPENAIKNKQLLKDLFLRLNGISIKLPPLRERKEDIPLLASYFMKKFSALKRTTLLKISTNAMLCLQNYHWQDNVGELQHLIERLVSLNSKSTISLNDLPQALQKNFMSHTEFLSSDMPLKMARKEWLAKFEKNYLLDLLVKYNGNISKIAKIAQVNRMTIYRLLNAYNISFKKSFIARQ